MASEPSGTRQGQNSGKAVGGGGGGGGVSIDWHHCGDLASQLSRFASSLKPPHIACACVQSHDPMACSPPGSSIHDILQTRILEWVAMPSSRGSSGPNN